MAKVGDRIQVPHLTKYKNNNYSIINKDANKKIIEGEVIQIAECTTVIVQARASHILEFFDEFESGKLYKNDAIMALMEQMKQQKRDHPERDITVNVAEDGDYSEDEFATRTRLYILINDLNSLFRSFQLVLVKVPGDVAFWYLLRDCDPQSLRDPKGDSGEIAYHHTIPFGDWDEYDNVMWWREEDVEFHKYCTELEQSIPGILTTIANWTKYGMLATAIRDFKIVEDLLRSPFVNRADLLPSLFRQYKQDYENLKQMERPSSEEISVYRGSFGYNRFHENFKVSTLLATSNNPLIAQQFVHNVKKKVKEFIIPLGYPIVDLRRFNPQEGEILLLPPVSFKLEKLGKNMKYNSNSYYNSYSIKQNGKGRKTRKNKHKK